MPILEPKHDHAHPVEADVAWSESYYFNAYDPGTDSGFFTRIGIRPNEGTMDVGPLGVAARRAAGRVSPRGRPARDGRRRRWWWAASATKCSRPCSAGASRPMSTPSPVPAAPTDGTSHPPVHLVGGRAASMPLSPAVGTDGQQTEQGPNGRGRGGHGHDREGPPRAGRTVGRVGDRRRGRPSLGRRPRQPRPIMGPAAVGRTDDVAVVQHQHRGVRCTSAASAWAPPPATCTAGGCPRTVG